MVGYPIETHNKSTQESLQLSKRGQKEEEGYTIDFIQREKRWGGLGESLSHTQHPCTSVGICPENGSNYCGNSHRSVLILPSPGHFESLQYSPGYPEAARSEPI